MILSIRSEFCQIGTPHFSLEGVRSNTQKSRAGLSQTRVKKWRTTCSGKFAKFSGLIRFNKHKEEAWRSVFEFWAVLVSESRLVSVPWRSTIGQSLKPGVIPPKAF